MRAQRGRKRKPEDRGLKRKQGATTENDNENDNDNCYEARETRKHENVKTRKHAITQ